MNHLKIQGLSLIRGTFQMFYLIQNYIQEILKITTKPASLYLLVICLVKFYLYFSTLPKSHQVSDEKC